MTTPEVEQKPVAPAESAEPAGAPREVDAGADSIKSRALRGSVWTVLGFGAGQVIRLGSNLVLAALLFPAAFGTMALINTLLIGLDLFSDVGIKPAIVQNRRGDEPRFYNTAWTIQVMRGFALSAIAAILAWPFANFYEQPELLAYVCVAGLTATCAGFCSTAIFRLNRHIALGRITLLEVAYQVVTSAAMITWAWVHPSIWALVGGGVIGAAFRATASHFLDDTRNRPCWDRDAARELFRFGRWVFISTVLTFFAMQCDRLVFGKLITREMLGIYSIAFMIACLPQQVLVRITGNVAFASYSRIIEAGGDLAGSFRTSRFAMTTLGGYVVAGMIATGHPVLHSLYDARYHDAAWMLQLLAIGVWYQLLESPTTHALLAMGRVPWLAAGNLAKVVAMAVLIPTGHVLWGFPGAVVGFSLSSAAHYLLIAIAARRHGLPTLRADVLPTLWVAGSGLGCYALACWLAEVDTDRWLVVAVTGLAVTLCWLPWGLAVWRRR